MQVCFAQLKTIYRPSGGCAQAGRQAASSKCMVRKHRMPDR